MKKCISFLTIGFLFLAGSLVLVDFGRAAETTPPPELVSMVDSLESCRKESMNTQWKQARLAVMDLRKQYTKVIPELVARGGKTNVNNFGMFLAKLMRSIQDQDKASSIRNLMIIEEITKSFMAHY